MAHCAHIFAPSCAWTESTEPKKRSFSIKSRFGDAIRAMKPGSKGSVTKEKVCVLNADAVLLDLSKPAFCDDEISTQSGGSRRSSFSASGSSDCLSRPESFEEVMLPGSPEEISPASSGSSRNDSCSVMKYKYMSSEVHELATLLADQAQSKFSGRVYQDVRNAFLAVDANGDGKLTPTEALAFCQHFDLSATITSRFFTLLDQRETGLADWSTFLSQHAPVFMKKNDHRLNAGQLKRPAIQ